MPNTNELRRTPLRVWPGVIVAVIVVLLRFVIPRFAPATEMWGVVAAVAGLALILLWWLFLSRAPWVERIGAVVVMIGAGFSTTLIVHESIAGVLAMLMIPVTLGPAFVAWAVLTRRLPDHLRRMTMVATIVLACGVWALLRNEGFKGESITQLKWRWTPTAEERLLAQEREDPKPSAPAPTAPETPKGASAVSAGEKPAASVGSKPVAPADPAVPTRSAAWPGFRGPKRDGVVPGTTIETDWAKSPPTQVWRRPIGPGWSSFAVAGDLLYTQEQRGDDEVVSAYRVSTGEPVWRHRDPVRFYEPAGGAGPRGTPAVHNGRVYTLGTTGILNALDAGTGAVLWSRNASKDTGAAMPDWGFTSSPLVVDDVLLVRNGEEMAAFRLLRAGR